MKLSRWLSVLLALVFVFSSVEAAPVAAKSGLDSGACSVSTSSDMVTSPVVDSKSKLAKLSINNKTGGYLSIQLRGQNGSYWFSIAPGKHRVFVKSGRYSYTVSARCGSKSGNVSIKKGKSWKWWCAKRK